MYYQSVRGITTSQFAVGISTVVRFTASAQVISTLITHISGGTVFAMGQSNAVITGITLGAYVTAGTEIQGGADIYMCAGGAASTVHIIQKLGQGFVGASTYNY